MDDKTNEVAVEQCDRDAAADLLDSLSVTQVEKQAVAEMRAGKHDRQKAVQAFARHRLTASEPLLAQARAQAVEDAARVAEKMAVERHDELALLPNKESPMASEIVTRVTVLTKCAKAIRALAQSEGEGKA